MSTESKKMVESITFTICSDLDPKTIRFSANIATPMHEQLIITPSDLNNRLDLTMPFELIQTEDCVFNDDVNAVRVYCYDRLPRNCEYFDPTINVTNFFKQSTSHLVIEFRIEILPFTTVVIATDVTKCN